MKINLITSEEHKILSDIQKNNPILTFENKGYEYIDKSKFSDEDKIAFDKITEILKLHIIDFVEFNNFRIRKNDIQIRFQYKYDPSFTGVGYILLDELLNGFTNETI